MRLLNAALVASVLASVAAYATPSQAQGTPPDVVRLRDGSMYRGTISELVAGDHVVIVGADGQSHRFAMKDVASAGPSATPAAAPSAVPPPPPSAPPPPPPVGVGAIGPVAAPAQVRFEANESDVQLELRTGQAEIVGWGWGGRGAVAYGGQAREYQSVCTAPCTAMLHTGAQRLGLTHEGKNTIESSESVDITGPGTLTGTYTSRTGTRIAGIVVLLGSVAAGTALSLTAFHTGSDSCTGTGINQDCAYQEGTLDGTRLALGMGTMIVGSIVGLVLMFQHDNATFTFVPLNAGLNGPREMQRAPGVGPQGLALQARF